MKVIYPFGNCGRAVVSILEFFGEDYKIDDIGVNDCVLISSKRYKYKIQQELQEQNITNYKDGLEYVGKKLNSYLKTKFPKNSVALIYDDYKGQKHFGLIESYLRTKNIPVCRFIYPDVLEYETCEYDFVICQDMIPFLNTFKLFICTGILTHIPYNSYSLRIPSHYYIFDYHAFYHNPKTLGFWSLKGAISSAGGGGFMSVSDSIRYKRTKEFYAHHGGVFDNLLKLGYPGLDRPIARYNEFCKDKKETKNNLIVFLSLPHSPFIESIAELITESLENGYRVIYKTHGGHLELLDKEKEIVKRWQDYENFVVCYEALSDEILFESLCVVEFRSSVLYTYPLITKKPALYLQPQFEFYDEEDNFYCSNLHIKIHNKEEFFEILQKLQDVNFRATRKAMIEDYINNCAYNVGSASCAIASFIDDFLKKYI